MIVQQINLYQERFYEKRLWFSAAQVVSGLLLLIAVAAIWSFLLEYELNQVERQNREVVTNRDSLTAELQVANQELKRLLEDTRLDREIASTARKISARKQVLHFVEGNQFGSGKGFSEYMVALSNLHVDDIWLRQVRLGGGLVQISGSALDASEIPPYFARFSDEAVFSGGQYDLFQLQRNQNMDWKVDFEIATTGGLQ